MRFCVPLPCRPVARIAVLLLGLLLLNGCARQLGENLVRGAVKGLNDSPLDSTVSRLTSLAVGSALETALRDSVQARLREKLDSLGLVLDRRVNASAVHLRDSLLSEYTSRWVQGRLAGAGEVLNRQVVSLLDDARGEKTRRLVASLRDELLGDSTLRRAGVFRDELLGAGTRHRIDSLVQQMVKGLIEGQVRPNADELVDKVNEKAQAAIAGARRIAWIVGGAALLFLTATILLYRRARLHKGTLRILTRQIDRIPDQQVYDWLVGHIRQETTAHGLEPHLQALLREEHLYQQPEWTHKDQDRAVLRLITEALSEAAPDTPAAALLTGLHRKAEELHLDAPLKSAFKRQESPLPTPAQPA
jgi:hypothetical protein